MSLKSLFLVTAVPSHVHRLMYTVMYCLCCSRKLLRHVGQDGLYWYCTACRQAMPVILKDDSLMISCRKKPFHPGVGGISPLENHNSTSKRYWLYIPLRLEHYKTA